MSFLLVNAGSSSLKVSLCGVDEQQLAAASVDWAGKTARYRFFGGAGCDRERSEPQSGDRPDYRAGFVALLDGLRKCTDVKIEAVGHRIVHGGDLTSALAIDDKVLRELEAISDLAPLHNPPGLEAVRAAMDAIPAAPHVAAFDTSFHRTMPAEAAHYAVPEEWSSRWRIKRYGFHGLSYAYCTNRAAEMLGRPSADLRLIICHLGHGCSAAAVDRGKCVDTTMGFTPLEGLMMATRSGSIDAGAVFHLLERCELPASELSRTLNSNSGLLGVSGVSADMREVIAAADSGNRRAGLAIAMFARRVRQTVGAYLATLGGADALVFTAGVGENSARIRGEICRGLAPFGFAIDEQRNRSESRDSDLALADSRARILVIQTREDISMLREVRRVLGR